MEESDPLGTVGRVWSVLETVENKYRTEVFGELVRELESLSERIDAEINGIRETSVEFESHFSEKLESTEENNHDTDEKAEPGDNRRRRPSSGRVWA